MRRMKALLLAAAIGFVGSAVHAEGIDDPARASYYDAFKGKTVA